jgi:hypothetical protein
MTRQSARRPIEGSGGSVLLEAVSGIGILVVMTAAVLGFHSAALDAHGRAAMSIEAVGLARALLEGHDLDGGAVDLGLPNPIEPASNGESALANELERSTSNIVDAGCDGRDFDDVRIVRVTVGAMTMEGMRPLVSLERAGWAADAAPDPLDRAHSGRLILDPGLAPGVDIAATSMTTGTTWQGVAPLAAGCVEIGPLGPGRHAIRVVDDAGQRLIDRSHRTASAAVRSVGVLDEPWRIAWDLRPAARLTVHIDPDGARLPDSVGSGGLAWSIRGDDHRGYAEGGATREVHPGEVTIVVSACRNPDAYASSRTTVVAAGAEHHLTVELATVTLNNVSSWPGATLRVVRTTACVDGAQRPSMEWNGSLSDGMRIALPRGEWEGQLRTTEGLPITSPVLFWSGPEGTEVRLS